MSITAGEHLIDRTIGLKYPKARPRVLDRIEQKEALGKIERACRKAVDLRDGRRCRYPLCGVKSQHKHHLVKRSQGGKWQPSNVINLCAFHHALIHAGTIGVSGTAEQLVWSGKKLYERKVRA